MPLVYIWLPYELEYWKVLQFGYNSQMSAHVYMAIHH